MSAATDEVPREIDEKNRVIAHLTQTLAHTLACLEIARAKLERGSRMTTKKAVGPETKRPIAT